MKYVQHSQLGNPADVLEVMEKASPGLEATQVRVKVLATPIHPANLLQIEGTYGTTPPLPAIPGGEGIGEVVEVAADVAHLSVGQLVLLGASGQGTWQQEIVCPAVALIPVPPGTDVEQLSMAAVNPLTAYLLLTSFTTLKEGDWVVQSAANSAVGEYLIQLAKEMGLKTVNIVRREELAADLKAIGADAVVVAGANLAERVKLAAGGANIALAVDAVGDDTFSALLESLTSGGTLVTYGALSRTPSQIFPPALIFNEVTIRGFWLSKWFETATDETKQAAFGAVIPLIATGKIKAKIDSRFSLDDIAGAVTRAAAEGRNGKVILTPGS